MFLALFTGVDSGFASSQVSSPVVLRVVAEDSMKAFFEKWLVEFQRLHPDIRLEIERGHRLPENRAALGSDTEELFRRNDSEFVIRRGYAPLNVVISSGGRHVIGTIQALGVFVHPENPSRRLTLEQVEAIFSESPAGGRPSITKWGELGLTGEWAERPISVYGRERRQGASNFFRNRALGGADYSPAYRECVNSPAVIDAVAADIGGIGYSALAYETPGVRALALADRDGGITGEATEIDVAALRYPLTYPLFISINRKPGQPLDPAIKAFLEYGLSPAAQEIVATSGFMPLPADSIEWELSKLR